MLFDSLLLFLLAANPVSNSAPSINPNNEAIQCARWIRGQENQPPRNTAVAKALSEQTYCFDGEIFPWTTEKLKVWLTDTKPSGNRIQLVVRSVGGDAATAIQLAERLQDLNAKVTVVDYCMSSCANYLFASVVDRNIDGRALVLFHGGYDPYVGRGKYIASVERSKATPFVSKSVSDVEAWASKQIQSYDSYVDRQAALFNGAGVALAVATVFYKIDEGTVPPQWCGKRKNAPRSMFFFDEAQYDTLGMPIRSGGVEDDPIKVDHMLANFGMSFTACRAPTIYLTPRPLPETKP